MKLLSDYMSRADDFPRQYRVDRSVKPDARTEIAKSDRGINIIAY